MRDISQATIKADDDSPGIEGGVLDIWPYVGEVPADDLEGHEVWTGHVRNVYRSADDHWDHVLVGTRTPNVFLVVVVDLEEDRVHGHILLDLNRAYGLETPPRQD